MIRDEVKELVALGPFGPSKGAIVDLVEKQEKLLNLITPPLTENEIEAVLKLFGADDYFGLAWTLLHLLERSNRPMTSYALDRTNEWHRLLIHRANAAP